jgi:hypothetical protein
MGICNSCSYKAQKNLSNIKRFLTVFIVGLFEFVLNDLPNIHASDGVDVFK